jgi:signal transduction histidine kinase/ActR/RegA family two-component response regulator
MGLATITTQNNPEAIPFLIAAAVAAAIATLVWRRRAVSGGPALFVMMVGEAGWALFAAAELLIADPPIKRLCFALKTGAAVATILGLLTFVLRYTGHTRWLSSRLFGVIRALAVAPLALAWTNDLHHLYWTSLGSSTCVQPYGTFAITAPAHGPVFWLHFGYGYILIAIAATLLVDAVARSAGIYRVQASVMLLGVLLPWAVNVVDMTQLLGCIHADVVAIAFAVTGLAMLPAFYRYRLLDLVPIAWAEVVRGMVDPVVVLDSSGRIVDFNAAAGELVGETTVEVIGLEAASAFRSWPALADRLADVGGLGGLPFDLDGPDRAGGRSFEARVSSLDDGGRPAGRVVVLRDVTERRCAEAEHAARVAAEASDRAKQTFLAALSHELRAPLTPMLAGADTLLGDPATPAGLRPTLAMIRRNAELEARLIDDLLDLTRVCHGRLHLNPEAIDAHVPIRHALEVCDADVRAKGLGLEVDLAAEASHVVFDPARLQQVAWNLVKNAVKFTPAGGRVAVRTRGCAAQDPGGRPWLVLEVIDTGIGIDPAVLPRVFDAFEQGDGETARRSGGLGLGLAICRGMVQAHGGRIAASSVGRGRGAMFRVELATVPAPAFPEPSVVPTDGCTAQPTLRVLLVEDNPDSREALSRLLRGEGFAIETAGDVHSAIALAGSRDFDVLISDIGLPDGSGLDVMRTLRDRGGGPIAGIAISGYGQDEDIRLSREAGFAAHLVKPLKIRELSASILRAAGVAGAPSPHVQ